MTSGRETSEVTRFLNAWFAVRQHIQASNFNRFQGAGLSATQFMALNLLPSDGRGIAIGELARQMNLKAATVAKTVDSLESRHMITRAKHPPDGRVVNVCITNKGVQLQNSAKGQFTDQIGRLFRAMTSKERAGLVRGLEGLMRVASQEPGAD